VRTQQRPLPSADDPEPSPLLPPDEDYNYQGEMKKASPATATDVAFKDRRAWVQKFHSGRIEGTATLRWTEISLLLFVDSLPSLVFIFDSKTVIFLLSFFSSSLSLLSSHPFFFFFSFYVEKLKCTRFETTGSVSIFTGGGQWYVLSEEGLSVVLVGVHGIREKVLNNLIMFESAGVADALCSLNHWDRRELKIHALELGLRVRQKDVLEEALAALHDSQSLEAGKLLLKFLQEEVNSQLEDNFLGFLLPRTQAFLASAIMRRGAAITALAPNERAAPLQEMTELAGLIEETRSLANPRHRKRATLDSGIKVMNTTPQRTPIAQDPLHPRHRRRSLQLRVATPSPEDSSSRRTTTHTREKRATFIPSTVPDAKPVEGQVEGVVTEDSPREDSEDQVEISRKVPENLPVHFGDISSVWERSSNEEIVRDGIVEGKVSLAMAFLKWRELRDGGASSGTSDSRLSIGSLGYFRQIAHTWIYQAMLQNKVSFMPPPPPQFNDKSTRSFVFPFLLLLFGSENDGI
jgi:hypothetical protein